jgi:hypothetical protein
LVSSSVSVALVADGAAHLPLKVVFGVLECGALERLVTIVATGNVLTALPLRSALGKRCAQLAVLVRETRQAIATSWHSLIVVAITPRLAPAHWKLHACVASICIEHAFGATAASDTEAALFALGQTLGVPSTNIFASLLIVRTDARQGTAAFVVFVAKPVFKSTLSGYFFANFLS